MKVCPYCAKKTHEDICPNHGKVVSEEVNVFATVVLLLSLLGLAVCAVLAQVLKLMGW